MKPKPKIFTLAILPKESGKDLTAVVSLFGGNGIPESVVMIGVEHGLLSAPNDTMDPKIRIGLQIDPSSRQATWITVGDIDRNWAGL